MNSSVFLLAFLHQMNNVVAYQLRVHFHIVILNIIVHHFTFTTPTSFHLNFGGVCIKMGPSVYVNKDSHFCVVVDVDCNWVLWLLMSIAIGRTQHRGIH
jgi:hypothetical protein